MTEPHFLPRQDPSVEFLAQRHDLFCIMRNSHLRWMSETNDERIMEMHRALAELLKRLIEQYDVLLNMLHIQQR